MSQAPDNLQQIATLIPELRKAREEVGIAERRVRILEMRDGQTAMGITFGGLTLAITDNPRESGYMPRVVPGMQGILAECLKLARNELIARRSKVEGLEFKLRDLAKREGGAG